MDPEKGEQQSTEESTEKSDQKSSLPDAKPSDLPDAKISNPPDAKTSNPPGTETSNSHEAETNNSSDVERSNSSDVERSNSSDVERSNSSDVERSNSSDVERSNSSDVERSNSSDVERSNSPDVERSNSSDVERSNSPEAETRNSREAEISNSPEAERSNSPEVSNSSSPPEAKSSSAAEAKSSNPSEAKGSSHPEAKGSRPSEAKGNTSEAKGSTSEAKGSSSSETKGSSSSEAKGSSSSEAKGSSSSETKGSSPPEVKRSSPPEVKKSSAPEAKRSNLPDAKRINLLEAKSNLPVVPNFDASSVRRSPRAPAKVKVNFNDIFNGESVKKKRSASAGSTSSSSNGSESSPAPPVISGPRKTDDGREIDTYCWLCHKVGEDSMCAHCPRVFHFQCLGPAHRFNEEGLCPECKLISTDGTDLKPSLTASKLAGLLPFALNRMMTSAPALKTFKYSEKECKDLVRPMDFPTLFQNIKGQHYKTTISFLSDAKWILHNLVILNGVSHSLTTNAKKLVSVCKSEMLDIEACPDCYEHAYSFGENWFCKLCGSNHTLVWAKLKGFPFWPAKVVKVIDGVADVRFFGSHEKGKVPVSHCYRLSKENPNDKVPKNVHFKKALEELELYTKNVHRKFGPVIYYPLATVYDPGPENISTKQVTRKRENVSSGLAVKSKKMKTLSNVSLTNKSPVVELNKLSEATVRISTSISSARATISSLNSNKNKQTESVELPVSKKQNVSSDENRSSVVNSKSTVTGESSAADKSLHKKNFMKHLELNTISPQGTSENPSKNCNGLPSSESCTTVISSGKEVVSNSCSVGNVGKKRAADGKTKSPQKITGSRSSDSVNSNPAGEEKSLSSPQKRNSAEVVEPLAQSSGTRDGDVSISEQTSENSEDVVMADDSEEVPSVPNTNNEESASGSRDEVSDTVTDVLNSLQFFVESSAAEPEQEHMYTEEQSHNVVQDDDVQVISSCPSSSSIVPVVARCNKAHSNPGPHPSECRTAAENMGPIFVQQPPGSGNSQEQPVCFVPLPDTFDLGKYQSKIYSLMRATMEEIWRDYVNTPHIQQIISSLQKEIEHLKAKYDGDMKDISENTALILESVKSNMKKEKEEAIEALKKKCEEEKEKAIKETKKKQWCAYCWKEAMYYCCWNTSYCDYPCQEAHWVEHMATCSQGKTYEEQMQQQQSPNISSDADRQRNQSGKSDGNCSKKFSKETYSKQQRSRGNHNTTMSNKGQMPPPYQSPPHPPPFVSTPQPPMMTPNYASNVIPNSVQVMGPPHITSVGPSPSPFVNRMPPPPPPAPNHQSLPFVSGQHPHQNQNTPHYQTANSQGNRMLTPVLPPHTSYQPRQYFSSPSTSKMYMAGPRDVRYPAKPYM